MTETTAGPKPYHWRTLLLNLALILPSALLYAVKTDSPVYPLISLAILLFAFFRRDYLPLRDRPVIYSVTAAIVLTIFPDLLIVIDDSRHGIFDLLIRSNLIIPLMLYLAAFSCAFYPYPARRGITVACVVSALVLCGDRFNYAKLTNDVLFFFDPLLQHYHQFYSCAAAWNVLAIPVFFLYPDRPNGPGIRSLSLRLRSVFLGAVLLLLPLSALAAAKYYYGNATLIRAVEYYILRISMRRYFSPRRPDRQRLSSAANLNLPLPPEWSQADTVLLRVRAKTPPGYLRSGIYDFYDHGLWRRRRGGPVPREMPADRRTGLVSYTTFTAAAGGPAGKLEQAGRIELYFAGLQSGGRIPVTGNLAGLDAVADSGEITDDGLVSLKQWHPDGGCTLLTVPVAGSHEAERAWQGPAEPEKDPASLAVPSALRPGLRKLWSEMVPADCRDDAAAVAHLRLGFGRFRYSLNNENAGKKEDPLVHFLTKSHAGHCEFYASAAVLLLRSAGIPARYVTGFLCEEKSPVSDYYLVRSSHAHAWCEAYLRGRRQWVLVDLTPDEVLETVRRGPGNNRFKSWLDAVRQLFQQGFADIRRGHFAQAAMDLLTGLWKIMWGGLRTIPGALAALIVIGLLVRRFLRKRKLRQTAGGISSEARRKLSQEFARFEKRYAAAAGKSRPEWTALGEFYLDEPAAELCRFYERLRYGADDPSPEQVREFTERAAAVIRAAEPPEK